MNVTLWVLHDGHNEFSKVQNLTAQMAPASCATRPVIVTIVAVIFSPLAAFGLPVLTGAPMEQTGKFRLIASHTLKWEGGYVWDRQDPGGETNMGISKRAYPDKDIKSLTYEEVLAIYYQDYYLPSGAALIESLPLASKHYDLCVNMGTRTATRLLQRAANGVGPARLAEDGRPGPLTLQVVNACDPAQLLAGLIVVAKDRYRAIIQKRPTSQKYWRGWMNRLEDTLI